LSTVLTEKQQELFKQPEAKKQSIIENVHDIEAVKALLASGTAGE